MNKIATLGVLVAAIVLLGAGTAIVNPTDSSLATTSETVPVVIEEPAGETAPIDPAADAGAADPAFILNSPFGDGVSTAAAVDSGGGDTPFLL